MGMQPDRTYYMFYGARIIKIFIKLFHSCKKHFQTILEKLRSCLTFLYVSTAWVGLRMTALCLVGLTNVLGNSWNGDVILTKFSPLHALKVVKITTQGADSNKNFVFKRQISHAVLSQLQYIPRNMHTDFALLCFVVVIHWLIFPYPSGLLHWHCGNLTIAPVPAKQPWWIWINTSCEFIMNDYITTTKQSTTKPCAYFLGCTVPC